MSKKLLTKIREESERLKQTYVDCSTCPIDDNCCTNFGKGIDLNLPRSLQTLLGWKGVYDLVRKKRLKLRKDGLYINGPCPFYEDRCTLHGKKENLNLHSCMGFPIAPTKNKNNELYPLPNGRLMTVDFRCKAIRKNWNELEKELRRLEGITPAIAAFEDGTFRYLPLDTFIEQLDMGMISHVPC